MGHRRRRGNATAAVLAVVLVLGAVAGAGTWNYLRNLKIEQQEFRPYRGVSEEELHQLLEVYQAAAGAANAQYERARDAGGHVRDHALLDERVAEFERHRRRGERVRELGGDAAELEASVREVEQELGRREADRSPLARILRLALRV